VKITELITDSDTTRTFMMRKNVISYRALLRYVRGVPEAVITKAWHAFLSNEFEITVEYKGTRITIETVWADTIIGCTPPGAACEEFIFKLKSYKLKWWEHITSL